MEGSPSFYGLAYKKIELMPFGFKLRKLTLLLFCLFPVLLGIEIKKFTLHSIEGGPQAGQGDNFVKILPFEMSMVCSILKKHAQKYCTRLTIEL